MDTDLCDPSDIERLYRCFSAQLEQHVRREITAPDDVIEEACQVAWSRLADPAHEVRRGSAPAWLMTTARREAIRLLLTGAWRRDLGEALPSQRSTPVAPAPDEVAEHHRRLEAITLLPQRQQQVLWLHAAGHSYVEIARYTGDTRRTVERQLLRARRAARQLAA